MVVVGGPAWPLSRIDGAPSVTVPHGAETPKDYHGRDIILAAPPKADGFADASSLAGRVFCAPAIAVVYMGVFCARPFLSLGARGPS